MTVISLARNMGRLLASTSAKWYGSAISLLEKMIRAIAKAAILINKTAIIISYHEQGNEVTPTAQPAFQDIVRDHSARAEYDRLALPSNSEDEAALPVLLQSQCNNLMRYYPRAALRDLRSAMLILVEVSGTNDHVLFKGEKNDE